MSLCYVSTEDPHLEIDPCRALANLGTAAATQGWGIPAFKETTRDTHTFSRRVGDLPLQRDGDSLDFRSILHRDGTVFSAVSASDLAAPEQLYRKLGAKLVVGMPFKDIATSDSVFLREVPAAADAAGRRALRRLQEVGVHVLAPIAALQAAPLPGAVAVVPLAAWVAGGVSLPEGAERVAVEVDGTESEEVLRALAGVRSEDGPVVALLNIKVRSSLDEPDMRLLDLASILAA